MLSTSSDSYVHKELTGLIIGAYYAVYNGLGYGFLESVYLRALAIELTRRGVRLQREAEVKVRYQGVVVGRYRADMIAEDAVVIEAKASKRLTDADCAQLLNCLRCSDMQVGLLLHFGARPSIKRFAVSTPLADFQEVVSASSAPRA